MSKINLLPSKVYNRISAGEVVERPASVIKELIENSIDAKSKNITIKITEGGISTIEVIDDGVGIEYTEIKKAFLSHATSKILGLKDLDSIYSLGFRGEALPSIASISKIKLTSKTHEQKTGYSVNVEGEKIGEIEESPSNNGTDIIVKNLFYNTPARAKFLKTPRAEESEITAMVAKFILGNPSISFEYYADNKKIYQSFGENIESAFISIYGPETINNCFNIETEKNGIKIKGYIGKHFFTKGNRTHQTVFLNGRNIINQTISAAINNAYSTYLMKRQYPFCVLSIEIPYSEVDVNVNPSKTDVRFSNNQIVYGSIYSVITNVLDGNKEALNIIKNNEEKTSKFNNKFVTHNDMNYYQSTQKIENLHIFDKIVFNDVEQTKKAYPENKENSLDEIFAENKAYLEKIEYEKKQNIPAKIQQKITIENELRFIGQTLNTYLIFEDGIDLYIIDQHAAHERILFDQYSEMIKNKSIDSQPLLVPYTISVNNLEFDFTIKNQSLMEEMGFELCDFGGNNIKISSVPVFLSNMKFDEFFKDLFCDLNTLKSLTVADVLKEKIAQKACKSAIKSGEKLCENDIKILIERLKGDLGLKCPHGRPIAVKISRTEIDKWFKRIV